MRVCWWKNSLFSSEIIFISPLVQLLTLIFTSIPQPQPPAPSPLYALGLGGSARDLPPFASLELCQQAVRVWLETVTNWLFEQGYLVAQAAKNLPAKRETWVIPNSGRFPGGGNGNPLQHSCLQNPMDRGAWRATVSGVAKSRTWLSD